MYVPNFKKQAAGPAIATGSAAFLFALLCLDSSFFPAVSLIQCITRRFAFWSSTGFCTLPSADKSLSTERAEHDYTFRLFFLVGRCALILRGDILRHLPGQGNGMAAKATTGAVPHWHAGGANPHGRSLQPQTCPRLPRHCPLGGRYGHHPCVLGLRFQPWPHPQRGCFQENLNNPQQKASHPVNSRCEAFSVCSVILVLSSAGIHNGSRR